MDAILTGKLRLIDQSNDPAISCDVCKGVGSMVAQEESQLTRVCPLSYPGLLCCQGLLPYHGLGSGITRALDE